jgi:hypothetical protein
MRRAASGLTGMRDYAGFTDKRIEKDTSTLVLVREAVLAEAGDLILVRLRASHFLWKMVRRVVGCLVGVGRGEISVKDFEGLFAGPSPYPARVTAPPSGLFLEEVIFPGEEFRRPLEPVLGVSNPREIPVVPALPLVGRNDQLREKHRSTQKYGAGRRGGAKGRSPAAERSEADGGPQRQDPAARTETALPSKFSTARGGRGASR